MPAIGFPSPFGHRRSLFGSSCSRPGSHGVPHGQPADHGPHRGRTLSGFPRSTPVRRDRGGCLLYPGDGDVLPVGGSLTDRHPPLHRGQSLHPAEVFRLAGLKRVEASSEVHSRSPVRSSPCLWLPDGSGALGRLLRASHPAVTSDACRSGDGSRTLTRNTPTAPRPHLLHGASTELVRPRVAPIRSCPVAGSPRGLRWCCPGTPLNVPAVPSFSECAVTNVASRSITA